MIEPYLERIVRGAPPLPVRSVLLEELHAARVERPSIPDLVGYSEIAALAGVSRQRAAQLTAIAGFPDPVVVTQTEPLRTRASVERWLERPRRSGRPREARTTRA